MLMYYEENKLQSNSYEIFKDLDNFLSLKNESTRVTNYK